MVQGLVPLLVQPRRHLHAGQNEGISINGNISNPKIFHMYKLATCGTYMYREELIFQYGYVLILNERHDIYDCFWFSKYSAMWVKPRCADGYWWTRSGSIEHLSNIFKAILTLLWEVVWSRPGCSWWVLKIFIKKYILHYFCWAKTVVASMFVSELELMIAVDSQGER